MPNRYQFRFCWLLCVTVLTLVVAGCPPFWNFWQQQPQGDAELMRFRSADELLDYFKQQATFRHQYRSGVGPFWGGFGAPADLAAPGAPEDTGANDQADGGQSFTTTNVQEVGVDESDVIKSDGTYFYIARDQSLRIVRASPPEDLAQVSRLDLDVRVTAMYLYGSRLLLLAQRYEAGNDGWDRPAMEIWPPYYAGSSLSVVEVDISDPTAPTVTSQADFDGALVDSRLTNDRLILVLTIAPDVPDDATILDVNLMPLDAFMPKVRAGATERNMVRWQECLRPASPDGYFMTAVLTIDAADIESTLHSVAVVAGAGTIYASTEALYITDTEYGPDNDYREMTAIHKFAFDENGAAQYVASGSVPGRLLNQFSLGEYEDYLRVATHVTNPVFFGWGEDMIAVDVADSAQPITPPEDYNAVYVLSQSGAELETVGAAENIAPDEDLHSARFIGDHGFVVTFRKIDPLFVLDLSDPTNPEVVGQLKVPGFSDYLHPLGDTHLIGVGKYTIPTAEGFDWFQGVQVSLFDVSDWSNPTAVQQITFGGRGSTSEVDYTHKGFTFLADRGLLAIPMRLYTEEDTPWEMGELVFDGVVCLQVEAAVGFTELGRLDVVSSDQPGDYCCWDYLDWRRAAFIGDVLYAISPDGVRAAPLSNFSATSEVTLPE